ncbi:Peptidylprolyl isomerase domain and WD repeat containing protein 1, partial [Cichlidogyrus casuarinus]
MDIEKRLKRSIFINVLALHITFLCLIFCDGIIWQTAITFVLINLLCVIRDYKKLKNALCSSSTSDISQQAIKCTNLLLITITVTGIFAVDFPFLPKYYAKVENFGISSFDVFVGLFTVSAGFSAAIRNRQVYFMEFSKKLLLPLLLLGLIRLTLLHLTGYNNHVTEYGVHWNFFFTLFFIRLLSYPLKPLLVKSRLLLCIIIASATTTLQFYILSPRGLDLQRLLDPIANGSLLTCDTARQDSLLIANAEGIVSLPGYLALFLWGAVFSNLLTYASHFSAITFQLMILIASMIPSLLLNSKHFCRRLVNVPFICVTLTSWMLIFTIMYFACLSAHPHKALSHGKPLLSVLSKNGMLFFLIGNVLTGMANLAFDILSLEGMNLTQYLLLSSYLLTAAFISTEDDGFTGPSLSEMRQGPPSPEEEIGPSLSDMADAGQKHSLDRVRKPPSAKRQCQIEDAELHLENLPTAQYYEISYMHRNVISHLGYAVTGYVISCSVDGNVKFWRKAEGQGLEFVKHYRAHLSNINDLSISRDGDLACTLGDDKTVKVFDVLNFDARSKNEVLHTLDNLHQAPITCIAVYCEKYSLVISTDRDGMIEYWSGPKRQYSIEELHPAVPWESKFDTDLFKLSASQSHATALAVSPDCEMLALSTLDRKIYVFHLLKAKMMICLDESLEQINDIQQSKQILASMEFGRRLAIEKELDRADSFYLLNLVFDQSSNFLLYTTMLGIRMFNLRTRRVQRTVGSMENMRYMRLALLPPHSAAVATRGTMASVLSSADLSATPSLELAAVPAISSASGTGTVNRGPDPFLICSAFKKHRIY